jgi:hypothetical protein
MGAIKSTAENIEPVIEAIAEPMSIAKPPAFNLDDFKSDAPSIDGVETLLTALPHHSLAQAKDWVRLHPDEAVGWSSQLDFVNVPISGVHDTLHLIHPHISKQYIPSGRLQRFRLAIATKPEDKFFLCHIPTQNKENLYNKSNLAACENAKKLWTQAISRRDEGVDGYKIIYSRDPDAFPEPKWPTQSLAELIEVTFAGRIIRTHDDPALLRLIGARQTDE